MRGLVIFLVSMLACSALFGVAASFGASQTKPQNWFTPGFLDQTASSQVQPDYLNPFAADVPEWDPFAPGGTGVAADRAAWDPYAPYWQESFVLEKADPVALGLTMKDASQTASQLYLEEGALLVTRGSIILGDPVILWAHLNLPGNVVLYDNGNLVLSTGYVPSGWYRIAGAHAEILTPHIYIIRVAGLYSNNVSVNVDQGGYTALYSLVGRVVDTNGIGMPGVTVRISGSEGGTFTKTTDLFGYYGMDVPSGYYVIDAQYPGYMFTRSTGRAWTGTVSAAAVIVGTPAVPAGTALPSSDYSGTAGAAYSDSTLAGSFPIESGSTAPLTGTAPSGAAMNDAGGSLMG